MTEQPGHGSASDVQQRAEEAIRAALSAKLRVPLAPRSRQLAVGARVDVDAASADWSIVAEIFARQGRLKGGQQKKVASDMLKLITIRPDLPAGARLIVAFADEEAAAYTQTGWFAHALRVWDVRVEVVAIDEELRDKIRAAQHRQRMVNATDVADDIVLDEENL